MPEVSVNLFQTAVADRYRDLLVDVPVHTEWAAMRDENGLYSPRLDIAVGPFATGELIYCGEYDALVENHTDLIQAMYEQFLANVEEISGNAANADLGRLAFLKFSAQFVGSISRWIRNLTTTEARAKLAGLTK